MHAVITPREAPHRTARPRLRALVVEDNAFIIELLRLVLEHRFEVLLATDAATGLALAQSEQPDVVITDLCFGKSMSGHSLLRAIRADATLASTPVLVISAHDSVADVRASLALGANAHIGKPFSPLNLLRCLETLWADAPACLG